DSVLVSLRSLLGCSLPATLCFPSGFSNHSGLVRSPFNTLVERAHRARQAGPSEAVERRRRQAGKVDLDDLLGAEELVEAAAEMAACLYNERARPPDFDPHHL